MTGAAKREKKAGIRYMPKKILQAGAKPLEIPVVRFMRKVAPENGASFVDVTTQVARVEIEAIVEDGRGTHALVRLDAQGAPVWRTVHQSLIEARWLARLEYGIEEKDWAEIK